MLHLGDITKISGYTAPIVDVVVGGSPCQDLSVAGKRAGLDGERSGLFMDQLRIIKEMRERDRQDGKSDVDIRPRYMVWENVPGAFSSNKAEDFRIVLEETAKVKDPQCSIPEPPKGKWTTAGCILGDGWSIAWRVCDAQFWGVPQRRRRIALVADFGGQSAPEILFVRKSVSGDTEPSQPQRKDSSTDASRGIGADDIFCIDGDKLNKKERKGGSGIGYRDGDKQYTLTAKDVHGVAYCFEPGAAKRLGGYVWEDLAPTLRTEVGDNRPSVAYTLQDRKGKAGGGNVPMVLEQKKDASFLDVEMEVAVRKYPVDCNLLCECLRDHKAASNFNNKDIAEALDVPLTKVEHWFRQDNSFAIPDPDVWFKLKELLGISTNEFDEAITTFENKGGNYDMRNRIYIGDTSPTLTCGSGNSLHLVPMMECFSKSKRAQSATDDETWKESDVANTLNAFDVGDKRTTECVVSLEQPDKCYSLTCGSFTQVGEDIAPTCMARDWKDPNLVIYKAYGFDQGATRDVGSLFLEEQSKTLTNGSCPGHHNGVVVAAVDCRNATEDTVNGALQSNMAHSLNGNNVVSVSYPQEIHDFVAENNADAPHQQDLLQTADGVARTLAPGTHAAGSHLTKTIIRVGTKYIVRRLTPLECERLQGYPDGWTDIGEWTDSKGKVHKTSDAARYKALGNSIALPPWKWVMKRLCACYERDATLASLFDGIGGFPLIWEQLNGKGSCIWASEIEDFPIAVTKKRIGE